MQVFDAILFGFLSELFFVRVSEVSKREKLINIQFLCFSCADCKILTDFWKYSISIKRKIVIWFRSTIYYIIHLYIFN